jgi:hypothetical protein
MPSSWPKVRTGTFWTRVEGIAFVARAGLGRASGSGRLAARDYHGKFGTRFKVMISPGECYQRATRRAPIARYAVPRSGSYAGLR